MKLIILNARAQLIKSFVSPRARCRRRLGVLKVVNNNAMQGSKQSYLHKVALRSLFSTAGITLIFL